MASGSFSGNIGTPAGGFALKVDYSITQNVIGNYSEVSAIGYVKKNNAAYKPYNLTSSASKLTVDGQAVNGSAGYDLRTNTGWLKVLSLNKKKVNHNADGSKSITISFLFDGKLTNYYPNGTINKTIELPTIPRASSVTLDNEIVEMGSSVTVNIARASTSFTHTLEYDFYDDTWVTFATSVATSATLTAPLDWASKIPNSTIGTGRIRCITYNSSTKIDENIIEFKAQVPENIIPTISSVDISDTAKGIYAQFGAYLKGKSIPKVVITASGSYGSTISNYSTVIDSITYSGSSFTSSLLNKIGNINIISTVTDSRGRKASKTSIISVIDYTAPSITKFTTERCTSNGTSNNEGTYIKVVFTGSIASCGNKNVNKYAVEYKLSSSSTWQSLFTGTGYNLNVSQVKTISGGFSAINTYDFRVTLTDFFNTSVFEKGIGTSFQLMNYNESGEGLALGKVSQRNAFEVAMDTEFFNDVKAPFFDGEVSWNNVINKPSSFTPTAHEHPYLPLDGGQMNGRIILPNEDGLYALSPSGEERQIITYSSANNIAIGNGGYKAKEGTTNLYGNEICFYINTPVTTSWYPYFSKGDSFTGALIRTAGFVTGSGQNVYFCIPLGKPMVGNPTINVSSVADGGLRLRQNNAYTHGSSATAYTKPTSYTAVSSYGGSIIRVLATFTNTTNVTNNAPIGIEASLNVTFT